MGKLEDKLAKLEEQRARINAEIQRVRAREQQQERRDDTRRKIIVGAMLTGMIEAGKLGQFNEVWLRAELDKQLDRDPDRALFGLPPLAKAKPEQVVQEEAPAGLHTCAVGERPLSRQNSSTGLLWRLRQAPAGEARLSPYCAAVGGVCSLAQR